MHPSDYLVARYARERHAQLQREADDLRQRYRAPRPARRRAGGWLAGLWPAAPGGDPAPRPSDAEPCLGC